MLDVWRKNAQMEHAGGAVSSTTEARLYKAARSLTVPTLIVRGGMSDVVSETVLTEFLEAVPHVQSLSVANAGHMVAGDSNHAFTRAIIDFLQRANECRTGC